MQIKTYQYYNNILCIPASLLYDDWGIMSYAKYLKMCERRQLPRVREGKGKGNEALLSYHNLDESYKAECRERLGNYKEVVTKNLLDEWILPDSAAATFFFRASFPEWEATDR